MNEHELEDWICRNWDSTPWSYGTLVGRQLTMKHGRCDILAVLDVPTVIELKAVEIKEKHIGQVLRYRFDLICILKAILQNSICDYKMHLADRNIYEEILPFVEEIFQVRPTIANYSKAGAALVGRNIDNKTLAAAISASIAIHIWRPSQKGIELESMRMRDQWDTDWPTEHYQSWMSRLQHASFESCKNSYLAKQSASLSGIFGVDARLTEDSVSVELDDKKDQGA